MAFREVELVGAQRLSSSVKLLRFAFCDGEPFSYVAGQWLNLRMPQAAIEDRRAYSIANVPDGQLPARFELAVTYVAEGALSPGLHAMKLGDRAIIDGPHGFFTREGKAAHEPTLFVGTGTGIAPLRAMLQCALADEALAGVPMTLLFGCRQQADILFREELESWERQYDNFQLHVTLSRPDAQWAGLRGYVQHHVAAILAARPAQHVYVCGLSAMVGAVRHELKALGLGRGAVHTERYD